MKPFLISNYVVTVSIWFT